MMNGFKKNNVLDEAHYGHKGRKGQRGGSLPSKSRGGAPTNSTTKKVKMGSEGTEVRVPTGGNVRGARSLSAPARSRFSAIAAPTASGHGTKLSAPLGGKFSGSKRNGMISLSKPRSVASVTSTLKKHGYTQSVDGKSFRHNDGIHAAFMMTDNNVSHVVLSAE